MASVAKKAIGFLANSVACGIKESGNLDLTIISSKAPCRAAGVFTTNKFRAAPVLVSQEVLATESHVNTVVINAGCANACTGEEGMKNARRMSELASKALGSPYKSLVMSTGIIGRQLPMPKVESGICAASQGLSSPEWELASRGIMTTDTRPKLVSTSTGPVTITGIAKGAGMIHPNMATMLGILATDANVSKECLQTALRYAADRSFNCISIDGDTSTNDTVFVLANGMSGQPEINDTQSPEFVTFRDHLTDVSTRLSKLIVRDGEGATKFICIQVRGATSRKSAQIIAKSIANSSLTKCAFYGQDPNWGRITCAVGYSGEEVTPDRVNLWIAPGDASETPIPAENMVKLLANGQPCCSDELLAAKVMKNQDITVTVDLGLGEEQATVWTCDFSEEYVKINADYST